MTDIFGVSMQALTGQILLGLINGSFYALLSLGLAVIFGMLRVINFAHGAFYMLGGFVAWGLGQHLGLGYWWALWLAPLIVGIAGLVMERFLLRRLAGFDHLYGLLLTFGVALMLESAMQYVFGTGGMPYAIPSELAGGVNLGFMFLPKYRGWVVIASLVMCLATWLLIEKTRIGAYLRAATDNPVLVQNFGINVPVLITLTYGFGVALAAFAGVLAAPIYQVSPQMGSNLLIVVFAVVVIGGMGSLMGAVVTGLGVGVLEGLTKVFFPQMSAVVIFVLMIIVLLWRPRGLFGADAGSAGSGGGFAVRVREVRLTPLMLVLAIAVAVALPFFVYPLTLMKILCFALFAASVNLLLGFGGLMSFGHAAFFGGASYVAAHAAKVWGLTPELAVLAGTGSSLVLGLLFGLVSIRRSGIYFAMITLALAQMVYFLALQMPFTGSEDGIQAVPRGKLFGVFSLADPLAMYAFVVVVTAFGFAVIRRLVHSPFGQVLRSLRENEPRAISLGYDVDRFKLLAFVISAGLAGLAGSTKALVVQLASLTDVAWQMSGLVILMVLLGGMGTFAGPLVGAALIIALDSYLSATSLPVNLVVGGVFVLCVLLFRRGIVGEMLHRLTGKEEDPA